MGSEPSGNEVDGMQPDAFQYPLSAVAQALAKYGYADLTIKKIAAESTRTEAALYRHYDSKDDLVTAFLDASIDWFTWEVEHIDTTDPVERLVRTCEVLTGDLIDWEQYAGLYVAMQELRTYAPRNEAFSEPLQEYHQFVITFLTDIIREGVDHGVFRDVDPEPTAALLVALSDAVPRYAFVFELVDAAEMIRDQLFNYIQSELLVESDEFRSVESE